jgi:hypothetical protein
MTYLEPGQRWKLPSGHIVQVISFDEEDYSVVNCAPVIDGVLCSDKYQLLTLAVRFVQSGTQVR